jgi:hypothetical protein
VGRKDEPEDLEEVRRDDRNLSIAGKRWEEDVNDPAIEHMRLIREDVEHDD